MSFDDWLLALHVLSAFALVAGMVTFWVIILAARRTDTAEGTLRAAPLVLVASASTGVGSTGAVIFGVWLAFSLRGYDIWDGWILAALVLWAIAMALGGRTNAEFKPATERAKQLRSTGVSSGDPELLALNRTSRGLWLHTAASLVILLILIDMIWKPGA